MIVNQALHWIQDHKRRHIAGSEFTLNSLLEIGAALHLSRKENALTQEQLADLANISERTVRAIETGTGNPSIGAVLSVASVLGLKIVVQK
ncbi:helix-turn-helix transcriptional regulator [Glutamicibacter ardleyensis]|uniref:helix-turn-helix transcriptional regulator n=1 Tax=Glutamicibacter ardleyensis TaxID=225894 RepID=UPI003FD0DFC2